MRAKTFLILASALLLLPTSGAAQIIPTPGEHDTRIRTVDWPARDAVLLTALEGSALTLIFVPGELIESVALSDRSAFTATIATDSRSVSLMPRNTNVRAEMTVDTDLDSYTFLLETGQGADAAYVVRFVRAVPDISIVEMDAEPAEEQAQLPMIGEYRLSGDSELRPASIADDGEKTFIVWGQYQSLPAVFGVGPSGDEEVVPGYMRDGIFTIDRVYSELVFRIDKERVRARRRQELGSQ